MKGFLHDLSEYGAILFGLLIGTIAHFGRQLTEGNLITFRAALGFVMQLGVIGLVAAVATRELGIADDDMRALATAVLAISTQEVFQFLKRNGWGAVVNAATPGKGSDGN